MRVCWLGAVSVLAVWVATPGWAQIDYRNVDDDRPTRVEDAYPVERYAFELLIPYGLERERGGAWIHASVLELEYGIARNAQAGVKLPVVAVRENGATDWGVSGLRVFGLYNFNTESPLVPAVSLRTDLVLPVGSLAGSEAGLTVKGIATRSWGRNRLHVNAAYTFGPDGTVAAVEGADHWWTGVALDRTLFRHSVLVIGEVYARKPVRGAPVEVNGTIGVRYQWRPTTVIDVGVSRGLRAGLGPEFAFTIGFSNAFAIPGLLPGGR